MKIIITGGNGFIGRRLVTYLVEQGHEIVVLDRSAPKVSQKHVTYHRLDLLKHLDPSLIAGAGAVVHLAGTPIIGRWSSNYKQMLRQSRIKSARRLIDAIRALPASARPNVVVSASAVGYYGDRGDSVVDERSAPGHDFLAKLCHDWEAVWEPLDELLIRRVSVRTGIVLAPNGGMIGKLAPAFRTKTMAVLGSGKQWVSWIGLEDLAHIYGFAVSKPSLRGPINAVMPDAMRSGDLMRAIGAARGTWLTIPVPAFVVRIVMGQAADVLLFSQRVKPSVLLAKNYRYITNSIASAISRD
jgi:hypothetical protein